MALPTLLPASAAPPAPRDDAGEGETVRRAQAGDLAAFEALYRRHVGRTYALVERLTGQRALAEELVQEIFARAWARLASFRADSAFATWLHTLALNVALDDRRMRARRLEDAAAPDAIDGLGAGGGLPEAGLDLERAILGLPHGARVVFVLHDIEGHGHEEIAARLGVTVGTTKSQLHRARQLLREALSR